MNKTDLVNEVAKVITTKKEAQAAVDCIISTIIDALANGENVTIVGFGTFSTTKREAREGRNPQTGEKMNIPAKTVPKFSAGKGLKEAVN